MASDIEIAQAATPKPITKVAQALNIPDEALEPYGRIKGKVSLDWLLEQPVRENARMILVTAVSPTPAGEGKTTTTVGLGDALKHIGKNVAICLREPSLGPVFGMKGGAAGGGYAQVIPMEDINLHFNGDLHAIGVANNLLSALLDNHIHHGNSLSIDMRRITWKRVLDMNDRALRDITVALGGPGNGYPRQDGFDIVVASEIMAISSLAVTGAASRSSAPSSAKKPWASRVSDSSRNPPDMPSRSGGGLLATRCRTGCLGCSSSERSLASSAAVRPHLAGLRTHSMLMQAVSGSRCGSILPARRLDPGGAHG